MRKNVNKEKHSLLRWILALVGALLVLLGFAAGWKWVLSQPERNPYTAEDFVFENGYLTCLTTESTLGIDVSQYQGEIDWHQVRQAGIEFAFIRLGYRSARDGRLYEDKQARKNLQMALDAGLKVGGYVFSQAMTEEEARQEAQLAIQMVKDYPITLPVAFDWEYVDINSRTDAMTPEQMTACIHSFCKAVEMEGYESMVYFNRDLANQLLDMGELTQYQIWFAMYDTYPDAPCKPDYWQYTNQGTVPGIEGNVDLNLFLR